MFGLTRWNSFDDVFAFQREVDRLFNQFWTDLPTRTNAAWLPSSASFRVNSTADGWHVEVPLAGVDPRHITLEVSGNTLTIRAEQAATDNGTTLPASRYEQTITVPPFLDVDKVQASHRHGMLQLMLPIKESVKPRRIQIEGIGGEKKQLTAVA
jgi:HSP20 family protein